jgi:small subunit ribosomal protein S11
MGKMHERGMLINMDKLEVVLRGFGAGREAFQKALMGSEGKGIKGKVTRVTDSTRLKFGGVRRKNVRRL